MNTFNSYEISIEEQERLDQPSLTSCSCCDDVLTVGEEECGEICTTCYFEQLAEVGE